MFIVTEYAALRHIITVVYIYVNQIDVDNSANNQFTSYEWQCYHVQEAEATRNAKNAFGVLLKSLTEKSHARIQKVLSEGSNFDKVFFFFVFFF